MFVLLVYLVIVCHCLVQTFATRCLYGSANRRAFDYYYVLYLFCSLDRSKVYQLYYHFSLSSPSRKG